MEGYSEDDLKVLSGIGAKAMSDPKLRKQFLKLAKEVNPEMPLPELELDSRLEEQASTYNSKLEELQNRLLEQDARRKNEELRLAPVKAGLLGEEENEELDKYMTDNGYPATMRMQAAKARQLEKSAQMADPTSGDMLAPTSVLPDDKELLRNPNKWARQQAYAAMNDLRRGKLGASR